MGANSFFFFGKQAHWFDMPRFWTAVAEVMRPGGTVALWTSYRKIAGAFLLISFL